MVLVAAARTLGPAGYAEFSVIWGLYFAVLGALVGLQQETTRAVASGRAGAAVEGGARPVIVGLCVGGTTCGALLVSAPAWGRAVLGDQWPMLVLAVGIGAIAYSGQSAAGGVLAGLGRWSGFAWVLTAEAVLRVVMVALAVALGAGLGGFAWATVAGSAAWVLGLSRVGLRKALATRADVAAGAFLRRCLHAMVGAGSSAVIVTGFPVLLAMTTGGPGDARTGVLLAAVTLTRAPLLMPLNAYQGALISRFVSRRHDVLRQVLTSSAVVAAIVLAGAVAATMVGPLLLRLLFGPDFVTSGAMLAVLVVAAGMLGLLTVTSAAVLAAQRHRLYAAGWLLAAAVTAAVLLFPLSLETRTQLALCIGPATGVALHATGLFNSLRRAGPSTRGAP